MKQKKILFKTKNYNILVSGIIIAIFTASLIISMVGKVVTIPFAELALSTNNIKAYKLWTLISYHVADDSYYLSVIFLILSCFILSQTTKIISFTETSKFLLYSSLIAAFTHILTTSPSAKLAGLTTILTSTLFLFSFLKGKEPIFRLFNKVITFNHIILILIVLNIVTAQAPWRSDSVSVTSQLAVMIYSFFFLKRSNFKKPDILRKKTVNYKVSPSKKLKDNIPIEKQVDAILDKINQKGIHTLSEQERDILNQASRKNKK